MSGAISAPQTNCKELWQHNKPCETPQVKPQYRIRGIYDEVDRRGITVSGAAAGARQTSLVESFGAPGRHCQVQREKIWSFKRR